MQASTNKVRNHPVKLLSLTSGSWEDGETASESGSVSISCDDSSLATLTPQSSFDDSDLLTTVDNLYQEETILDAARALRGGALDPDSLPERYRKILNLAREFENSIFDITSPPDDSSGWTKQGERHGKRPSISYNKLDENCHLSCRIETAIEASLLIPLLSVLNETDIYKSWIPSFPFPKVGLHVSKQLERAGRADQTMQLVFDFPWPFAKKEIVWHARALDDIDSQQYIVINVNSVKQGPLVPPLARGTDRIDLNGTILCRACPPDHELAVQSKTSEPLVLVSFKIKTNDSLYGVPRTFINFFSRTVLTGIWAMLIRVAEGVRRGDRPLHEAAIKADPELYNWIKRRTNVMLDSL